MWPEIPTSSHLKEKKFFALCVTVMYIFYSNCITAAPHLLINLSFIFMNPFSFLSNAPKPQNAIAMLIYAIRYKQIYCLRSGKDESVMMVMI